LGAPAAEAAARLIRVAYHDLPAVFDPEEALRPGAPLVHDTGATLAKRVVLKGNPDAAFSRCRVIVDREYTTSFVEHTYLEPDAGLAYIDENGVITVYASTQNPHYDQKDVAELLGVEEERVRIIQATTGGGFGSKLDLNVQGFVALATFLMNRPATMVYSREEAYLATVKRHPLRIRHKLGADGEGRLLAADVRIVGDTGAYASYGPAVCTRAALHVIGPYEVPNVRVESVFAYTNNPPAGAMRGFGAPQAAFAHESQMDLLAEALGISPMEIRRRNCLRVGSLTASGQELTVGVGIGACLEAAQPYYDRAVAEKRRNLSRWKRRGVGVGAMMYGIGNTGMRNPSTAHAQLDLDGGITLFTGAADIGQGSSTVLAQIAAEVLGVAPQAIRLVVADTMRTTSAGATSASRQTYISGNAVLDAAQKLKDVMLTEAAMILKTERDALVMSDGWVRSRSNPEIGTTYEKIARRAQKRGLPLKWQGYFDPDTTPLDPETGRGRPYATYAFAAHVAEVEVDLLTGTAHVVKVVAAHDVGKAVNPQGVNGQICSGVAMGLGFALMEEFRPRVTLSMKDYYIPTAADMPEIIPIIVEDEEPTGPFGAKGVGEPALIPTAPAILNALADALGVRIWALPANLERIMKACVVARPPGFMDEIA
jgi:CO/xanthine dehydrogenase Mo-binding subunit